MTANIASQASDPQNNPMLSRLTLTAAGLTIFLAVLSLIFSNRLETLRVEYQDTIRKGVATEANAELNSVTAELDAMKQSMEAEKTTNDKLKKKIAVITKESEKIKSELALAQKTIKELRSAETSAETMESLPFSDSPISDGLPMETPPNPDTESKDLLPESQVQPSVSSHSAKEPQNTSLTEESVAPAALPVEPAAPSISESIRPEPSAPEENEIASDSNQTQ